MPRRIFFVIVKFQPWRGLKEGEEGFVNGGMGWDVGMPNTGTGERVGQCRFVLMDLPRQSVGFMALGWQGDQSADMLRHVLVADAGLWWSQAHGEVDSWVWICHCPPSSSMPSKPT